MPAANPEVYLDGPNQNSDAIKISKDPFLILATQPKGNIYRMSCFKAFYILRSERGKGEK